MFSVAHVRAEVEDPDLVGALTHNPRIAPNIWDATRALCPK
jgi:hypothetical protein